MLKKRALCYRVVLILLAFLTLGAVNWWYTAMTSYLKQDFSNFWLAGHMLAAGQNPFSTSAWKLALATTGAYPFNNRFQYPPWSAVMLTPLGILPFHLAITLFLILTELSIVGIFWLGKNLAPWHNSPRSSLYLFALLPLLFRPILLTLFDGQITLLWLFAALFSVWLITTRRDFWGGMMLAALLFKPQLAMFPIFAVICWACWTKRWAILGGIAGGGGTLLMLSAPLLVRSWGDWVQEIVSEKSQDIQVCPTVWGLMHYLLTLSGPQALSRWYYPVSIALCLLIFSSLVVTLSRIHIKHLLPPHTVLVLDVSAGLILSVTIIPYAHNYDQAIVLVPFLLGYALTQLDTIAHRTLARLLRCTWVGAMTALPTFLFALSLFLQADNWSLIEPIVLLLLLLGGCSLLPDDPVNKDMPAIQEESVVLRSLF